MEQAILWTKSLENTDHLLNLKREARRDLIAMFAEVGNHKKAHEYFERFIGGDTAEWIEELAKQYESMGFFEKSTDLYTELLYLRPTLENKITYYTAIISGNYQMRRWDKTKEAMKELVSGFQTYLAEPQTAGDKPSLKAEKTLNEVILAQHFEFDKNATPKDTERIVEMDKTYLAAFQKWPGSQMPLYQYAHVLLKNHRITEAAVAFKLHWSLFEKDLKEPIREEALRNLIHSFEALENEKQNTVSSDDRIRDLLAYTEIYAQKYSTSKQARPIAFLRSVTLFKANQSEKGIAETQTLFDINPGDEFGAKAFKNLRVAYYNLKDWKRAYDWSTEQLKYPAIVKSPYAKDLRTVQEEALFLWADNTKEADKAADLYLQVAQNPEMQRLRPQALYNAFQRYQEQDKRVAALETAKQLEKTAPGSKELKTIAGIRAAYYQEAGDFDKALPLFETFLGSPDIKPDVLQQTRLTAGFLAEGIGKTDRASQLLQQYLSAEPKPSAEDAKRSLTRISEKSKRQPASIYKKSDTLIKLYEDLQKKPLPPNQDLAARIQGGAQKLESTIKSFLEVSTDPQAPAKTAFEAFCTIPFLYGFYQEGVKALGKDQPEELKTELEKIVSPLNVKASEIAVQCIEKAADAYHDGPQYRKVLTQWGYLKNEKFKAHVDELKTFLSSGAPWIEPSTVTGTEESLIQSHLEKTPTPDSWYALAKTRFDAGKYGHSRLTIISGLAKEKESPRLLCLNAVIEQALGSDAHSLNAYYDKALSAGSAHAALNLALIHLAGGRIDTAYKVLEKADAKGLLGPFSEVRKSLSRYKDLAEEFASQNNASNQPVGSK
jgi:hypothetical protein